MFLKIAKEEWRVQKVETQEKKREKVWVGNRNLFSLRKRIANAYAARIKYVIGPSTRFGVTVV